LEKKLGSSKFDHGCITVVNKGIGDRVMGQFRGGLDYMGSTIWLSWYRWLRYSYVVLSLPGHFALCPRSGRYARQGQRISLVYFKGEVEDIAILKGVLGDKI